MVEKKQWTGVDSANVVEMALSLTLATKIDGCQAQELIGLSQGVLLLPWHKNIL